MARSVDVADVDQFGVEPDQPEPAVEQRTAPPQRPTRFRTAALMVGSVALAAGVFRLAHDSLTDDAYITLDYARNVATHLNWGLIPQQASNAATSPLNVILLAVAMSLLRVTGSLHPVGALGLLNMVCAAAMAWGWSRIVRTLRLPWITAVLGIALVQLNPFVDSALGLEVMLIPTVLVLLVAMAVEGRPAWCGVLAGLALLTRLDLVVFVGLITLATPAVLRRLHLAVLTALAISAPWFAFSWFYFGSAVPDTFVIKTLQGTFGGWTYARGPLMYFPGHQVADGVAFLPALLGLLAVPVWLFLRLARRSERVRLMAPAAALGLGGAAYYGVYSKMGVPPYHWYFVAPTVSLATFLAIAVGGWLAVRRVWSRVFAVPALLVLVAFVATAGQVAVAQGLPWRSPVFFGNWASQPDYARVGTDLAARLGDHTVRSPGEIGTIAYFCQCAVVDEFADRGQVIPLIDQRISTAGPLTRRLLELNYHWLNRQQRPLPQDYRLLYDSGPGSGPDVWQVWSAARGIGHFTLAPAP